jgi:uncharacterized protein YdeI (YjbR/CyaY-like superfamily)
MPKPDPRIDAYIEKSADFAQPILEQLRAVVHEACPDVEETLKWSMPTFMYHGIMCSMAAFKQHCTFGFWKGALLRDRDGRTAEERIGRIEKPADLPSKRELHAFIRQAMALNEEGVKAPRTAKKKPALPTPPDLAAALRRNAKARATFEGFAPSHRREYIEWITEAKREETRMRRIAQAVEWLAEGKQRNWRYQ